MKIICLDKIVSSTPRYGRLELDHKPFITTNVWIPLLVDY